jgi:hypothetical protein
MSGEQLRYDATYGNWKTIRRVLQDRANTAEADEYGLTPLMLAVWNGHIECVKYLVCNDVGIDVRGVKVLARHLQSCRGFTALHLAGLDAPKWAAKEITWLLLAASLDRRVKCNAGRTPEDYARMNDCADSLAAFQEFDAPEHRGKIEELRRVLREKYTFIHDPHLELEAKDLWREAKMFTLPGFLLEEQHVGAIPDGMRIHEHQIEQVRQEGYSSTKDMVQALKMLDFSVQQAEINQTRRAKLLSAGDTDGTWDPADLSSMRADKARSVIRAHSPYEKKRRAKDRHEALERMKLQEEEKQLAEEIRLLKLQAEQEREANKAERMKKEQDSDVLVAGYERKRES